ncbi:MAG: dihydrofolate reductase [Muribaculaceae bacterium]|nr:dihydrofolate reductase [Muribaculaceae bacterium]
MSGVNLIVALGRHGEIGREGSLIWHISGDLKRFKALTMGHPVIMGRKTWESLPKRPLPGRRNIILSRREGYATPGAEKVSSVEEALEITAGENPFIIGGAEVYGAFLPHVSDLFLTRVDAESVEADAFLDLDLSEGWQLIEKSPREETPEGLGYHYETYKRKS